MLRIGGVDGGPWAYLIGSAIAGIGYWAVLLARVRRGRRVRADRARRRRCRRLETSFELGQALGL